MSMEREVRFPLTAGKQNKCQLDAVDFFVDAMHVISQPRLLKCGAQRLCCKADPARGGGIQPFRPNQGRGASRASCWAPSRGSGRQ